MRFTPLECYSIGILTGVKTSASLLLLTQLIIHSIIIIIIQSQLSIAATNTAMRMRLVQFVGAWSNWFIHIRKSNHIAIRNYRENSS